MLTTCATIFCRTEAEITLFGPTDGQKNPLKSEKKWPVMRCPKFCCRR